MSIDREPRSPRRRRRRSPPAPSRRRQHAARRPTADRDRASRRCQSSTRAAHADRGAGAVVVSALLDAGGFRHHLRRKIGVEPLFAHRANAIARSRPRSDCGVPGWLMRMARSGEGRRKDPPAGGRSPSGGTGQVRVIDVHETVAGEVWVEHNAVHAAFAACSQRIVKRKALAAAARSLRCARHTVFHSQRCGRPGLRPSTSARRGRPQPASPESRWATCSRRRTSSGSIRSGKTLRGFEVFETRNLATAAEAQPDSAATIRAQNMLPSLMPSLAKRRDRAWDEPSAAQPPAS